MVELNFDLHLSMNNGGSGVCIFSFTIAFIKGKFAQSFLAQKSSVLHFISQASYRIYFVKFTLHFYGCSMPSSVWASSRIVGVQKVQDWIFYKYL